MKSANILLTVIFAATVCSAAEQSFNSPDDAIKALKDAAADKDQAKFREIFGSGADLLLTGDKVQDAKHRERFAQALEAKCQPTPEGENKVVLEVGTNDWPFPIPLVKGADSHWHFDTDAGREEIIDRHIGHDELHAIGVCEAYVEAQKQFAAMNSKGGEMKYAKKFRSSEGEKDGLYWRASEGEQASPLSELVAQAHAEGYHHKASELHPYYGYYFKILTRQGPDAPGGKMNYMHHGELTGGFALVAYPEKWNQSGIMTFIVNQDGKVYQNNLGPKTKEIASSMKEYNPNTDWSLVQDKGLSLKVD